jgi:hypothetical protein
MRPNLTEYQRAPPRAEAPAGQRIGWIRQQHRLYARELAVEYLLDPPPADLPYLQQAEAFSAAIGFGIQCKATPEEIITAAATEWADASRAVSECLDHMRRLLWPMCAAKMPEQAIRQAAAGVCERHNVYVPRELLTPLLSRTWDAATRRRRPHARSA